MFVQWYDEAYDGAPGINIKRPYGNSDCYYDVIEILDICDVNKYRERDEDVPQNG